MISKSLFRFFASCKQLAILITLISLMIGSCKEEPKLWTVDSTDQVASNYIKSNPEYSEFAKLIEVTGLESLLGIRGPYTVLLPNNDAMFAYYKLKGVSSLMDFDEKFRRKLALNHIITNEIQAGEMRLGALRDTNAIGDFIISEFQGSDIILNKYSKIINQDVRLANGYAHILERVIDPITKDIYTVVAEDPSYKIFTEGLKITGLKDTLEQISFPYGNKSARTRFTLLAVPDTIYQRKGINNVNDLINWTGANPDSVTHLNNPFYRYMEYHCLAGTYYLSDLETKIYPILSHDNNVSMTIDTDYKINYLTKTKKYTAFIVPASNTPAKNGALHAISDLLPVTEPDPTTIIFETTDFFDLKQKDCFRKYYDKWEDGKNTFAKIHWVGNYMQYYYKPTQPENLHNDALQMFGYWSISVTFPKVMKGKYKVSVYQPVWGNSIAPCHVYLDGVRTPYNYETEATGGSAGLQKIADADFKTTAEHTITLENFLFGGCWWDYAKFEPVTD
jgi:uncharacterized surface protein with fasciclin (FAS1) repeats